MTDPQQQQNFETTTLGGGCYWCIEAVLQQVKGIKRLVSGFSGGADANPPYEMVCSGQSDHIEVVQVEFDYQVLPFEQLLAVFFAAHDPTQLNRQGHDVGPQYRSVVFYHNEKQHEVTKQLIAAIDQSAMYTDKVVTEVRPAMPFYPGPEYHQDYYNNAQSNPYCHIVIKPKIDKIRQLFSDKLNNRIGLINRGSY